MVLNRFSGFHEVFHGSLSAAHAAAAVSLETDVFLEKISKNVSLQNLLGALVVEDGTVKRDAWTSNFNEVISVLNSPDSVLPPFVQRPEIIPGAGVYIPDPNLRAAIEEALGKASNEVIKVEEMEMLIHLNSVDASIQDLTGLQLATNLETFVVKWSFDGLLSDLTPLAGLTKLKRLSVSGKSITDLSPFAGLINIEDLVLFSTSVSDLSPLMELTKMKRLSFNHAPVSDLSPLAGLTNLEKLEIFYAESPSLEPLKGLVELKKLSVGRSRILDISPLAGLVNLEELELFDNHQISDVSPLASLRNLRRLNLHRNKISDVSSLASLHDLVWIDLALNNISDISPLEELPKDPNIIWYENPGFPVGGPKIEGPWLWAMVPGPELDSSTDFLSQASSGAVTELQIAIYGAVEGESVGGSTWTAHKITPSGKNNISEMTNALGWSTGEEAVGYILYGSIKLNSSREQQTKIFVGADDNVKIWFNRQLVHKRIGDRWDPSAVNYQHTIPITLNEGVNVLLVAIDNKRENWSGFFGFTEGTEYTVLPLGIAIPDPNLRSVIAEELGKGDSAVVSITAEEMAALTVLNAEDKGIKDLRGIEFATNLVHLNVRGNSITDLSPIIGLNQINKLRLRGNSISDFSGLAGLESLKELWISGEGISDFSTLSELTNLEGFGAWELSIDDISHLSGFTKLRWLELGHNNKDLPDISPLANFTGLKRLVLYGMGIKDISPLANLKGLKDLTIAANKVVDVSPLAGLTDLVLLSLEGNDILDFSPLEELFGKVPIWTGNNPGFPTEGPIIEGPWLWMIAPITGMSTLEAANSGTDFLAQLSDGTVTELEIATEGAKQGEPVGDGVWTIGKVNQSIGNINEMVNATSLEISDTNRHIAYGSIILGSPKDQKVNMLIGSSDSVKVWLNGQLVHDHPTVRGIDGYTEFLPVTLQKGANVLLVAIYERRSDGKKEGWTGFFGFEEGTEYTVIPPGVGFTFSASVTTLLASDTFTLNLNAENITDLAGWQTDIAFDPNVLEAVEVTEGDFLKSEGDDTFFQGGTIDNIAGKITGIFAVRQSASGASGTGTLLSVTFMAKAGGETQVTLENFEFISITDEIIPTVPPNISITVGEYPAWDVNQDGRVSIQDLILVAKDLGSGTPANLRTDVNRDGEINIQDLILVARHIGESTDSSAAPTIFAIDSEELMPEMIETWIEQAQTADDGSLVFRQGIENLKRLLASLIPEKTALLANYPNPFNPETWIPYHLAKPADVTLTIYATNGSVVRTIALGHQVAGIYQSRNRAAYWDGRNAVGESVASSIYFYTLTAGDYTATRKMLIIK